MKRCELVVTSRPAGLMVVGQLEVMRNQKASTFGFGERENVWSYRNIGKIGREGEKEGVSLYILLIRVTDHFKPTFGRSEKM